MRKVLSSILLTTAFFIAFSSCKEKLQLQTPTEEADFDKEFALDSSIKIKQVRNVAYGYNFSFPESFREMVDTTGQLDSSIFYSADRSAKIKFFVEGNIPRDLNSSQNIEQDTFERYFEAFINGETRLGKGIKSIKSTCVTKEYEYRDPAKFIILAQNDNTEIIMKSELSEVPIDAHLTFKSFVMEYPKARKAHFRPLALEIAKSFGQYYSGNPLW